MRRRITRAGLVIGLIGSVVVGANGPVPPAGALPAGFTDTLVTNVPVPTAIAGGATRLYITTQPGILRVYRAGTLQPTAALNLQAVTCANSERGMLGIALDPAFPTSPYAYIYYTRNISGLCVNRVSRFTANAANLDVFDPASELVLVDRIHSTAGNHNAGDVAFGKDGMLYVSVGDGGCDYASPSSGCAGANDAARDKHVLLGKILRITPTGGVPATGNPFPSNPNTCRLDGITTTGTFCPETFAWGLRNPFRIAMDPNAAGTRFFINDVGQNAWEEIDESLVGADYGWNVREGHCVNGSTSNCGAPPTGMTNPIFDYGRSDGCASITGGAFVPNGAWSSEYNGAYLFADYVCGKIFRLVPNGTGGYNRVDFHVGLGGGSAVHLEFIGNALYYTTYAGGGQVRAITFQAPNGAPTARMTASPTSGPRNLLVNFNGSQSTDPEGGALQYEWAWGDGTAGATTTSPTTTHTYTAAGTFTASLIVRDPTGTPSPAPATQQITVTDPANRPPTVDITSPSPTAEFAVNQAVSMAATTSDLDGDTVTLSWNVQRRHNAGTPSSHTHPWAAASTFNYPAPEDLAAVTNSWLEVTVTASDGRGGTATDFQILSPNLVNVTLASAPVGTTVTFAGSTKASPGTFTSWQGWPVTITAKTPKKYRFVSWSLGGGQTHVFTTPANDTTNTVTWTRQGGGPRAR